MQATVLSYEYAAINWFNNMVRVRLLHRFNRFGVFFFTVYR